MSLVSQSTRVVRHLAGGCAKENYNIRVQQQAPATDNVSVGARNHENRMEFRRSVLLPDLSLLPNSQYRGLRYRGRYPSLNAAGCRSPAIVSYSVSSTFVLGVVGGLQVQKEPELAAWVSSLLVCHFEQRRFSLLSQIAFDAQSNDVPLPLLLFLQYLQRHLNDPHHFPFCLSTRLENLNVPRQRVDLFSYFWAPCASFPRLTQA